MEAMRKPVRSVLFRYPRLYDALTSQWRYRALYGLRLVHERDFRAFPLLTSRPDPLVLDVGGNIGQSVLSVLRVLPHARIVTFEPNPVNLPDLRRLERRFPNVRLESFALSDVTGEADLYTPVYRGKAMTGLASFDYASAADWLGPDRVYGFDSSKLDVERATLRLRPLDDLGLSPDFIKIDVQGLEHQVINGGIRTITRSRPVVMAEAVAREGETHRLLASLNYELVGFQGGRFAPSQAGAVNTFLIPAEKLPA
jgi:FkbM family methyltransferase